MIMPIKDFSNAGVLKTIKHRLIAFIAGNDTVVMNAKIQIVEFDGKHYVDMQSIKCGLFQNVQFPCKNGNVLKFSPHQCDHTELL